MPTVLFDSATHTYRVDGHKKPSVTGIIKSAGLINDRWFDEASAFRGSVVHRCCELHCKGTLDPETVDPMAQGYLDAWIKFKRVLGFVPLVVEKSAWHQYYNYCGTPDRFGYLGDGTPCVVDLKTGPHQKWHALQLAGYMQLLANERSFVCRRYGIQLKADGEYDLDEYPLGTLQSDWAAFLACLTISNWKRVNNAN